MFQWIALHVYMYRQHSVGYQEKKMYMYVGRDCIGETWEESWEGKWEGKSSLSQAAYLNFPQDHLLVLIFLL